MLLGAWARDGLSEEQISKNMGISRSTLKEWKQKYPAISATLKKGKEVADIEVENALFKRATGYEVEETKVEIDSNGKKHMVKITKHIAPDPTSIIFWLKNRRPEKWRDKPMPVKATEQEMDLLSAAFKELEELADGKD